MRTCASMRRRARSAAILWKCPRRSDARDQMPAPVLIPDAGRVWWVAQLRARREAIREAGRPITAAHVIALACAAGLAGACFGATSAWFQAALRWAALRWAASGKDLVPSATAIVLQHGAIAASMAVLLFLVPAAVYLAMGRD